MHLWNCGNVQSAHYKDLQVNKLFVSRLIQAMCLTITLTFKVVLPMLNLITVTELFPKQYDQVRINADKLKHRIHFCELYMVHLKGQNTAIKYGSSIILKWVWIDLTFWKEKQVCLTQYSLPSLLPFHTQFTFMTQWIPLSSLFKEKMQRGDFG